MTGTSEPGGTAARQPGRISKAITRLFMKRATIAAIEDVADRFRLVTLEGEALRGVTWTPGQKVQIAMGSAFVARTYTPIDWDAATGRTRLLGYAHGDGPGSAWLSGLAVGDQCDVFGPRGSLDLGKLTPPLALVGDETSIGLAYALMPMPAVGTVSSCFEVGDIDGCGRVLAHLGIERATLVPRRQDDTHIDDLIAALDMSISAGSSFVLTGKAGTIQRVRRHLKQLDVSAARIFAKAYWAPGKRGLD